MYLFSLTFRFSANHPCFIAMVAVAGHKLPAPAFQQGILITTATQTFIVEDGTWPEVGMLQGCANLTAWTAKRQWKC